jgi:acyl-CoA synthetase (NDP forming)
MLAPIPTYRFPEGAIAALARVVAYADWRQRPRRTVADLSREVANARRIIDELLDQGGGWLRPADAQRVLYVMGIPTLPSHPVAMHKSDVGGV